MNTLPSYMDGRPISLLRSCDLGKHCQRFNDVCRNKVKDVPNFDMKKYESRLARFEMQNYIFVGSGAFGTVYIGDSKKDHTQYSVKVVKPRDVNSLGFSIFLKKVRNELHMLQSLEHENIIRLIDYILIKDDVLKTPMYVAIRMERLDATLSEAIECRIGKRKLDEDNVVEVFSQMASALLFMHQKGLVHHDIKSDNIMVANMKLATFPKGCVDLRRCTFKLIDLGLAKKYFGPMRTTIDKAYRGTMAMMAPEKRERTRKYNPYLSDSYALGCTLLTCLVGISNFVESSERPEKLVAKLIKKKHLTQPKLIGLIEGLLNKDANSRFFMEDAIEFMKN